MRIRGLFLLLLLSATGSDAQLSDCGVAPLNTRSDRIVGGQDAPAGAWPWQARLEIRGSLCGGSLISNQWVLSAAHCFSSTSTSGMTIYLGLQSTSGANPNSVSRGASLIIVHPNYNSNTNDNDLSLVKLSSTVTFTNFVRPVCLAAAGSVFAAGLDCWVTGWGSLRQSPTTLPTTLQEVDIPVVSNSQCSSAYSTLTSNMLCAGLTSGGKDSCQGDSGGPLVTKNGSVWVQAGVVSFGIGCAQAGYPGVYARVSNYQTWINSTVSGNSPGFINFQGPSTSSGSGGAGLVALSLPLLLSAPTLAFSLFVLS